MVVGSDTTHGQVADWYQRGHTIVTADGYDVTSLCCPHCDLWIGDPDWDAIGPVSVSHDVGRCPAGT